MTQIVDSLVKLLGVLGLLGITAAGAASAAYLLFRTFGAKWLDAKFSERLENYKHAQQQELERVRAQINAAMDRRLKLHQREFDTLPELWSRLSLAMGEAIPFISRLQEIPNLDIMNTAELDEFLSKSPIADWQKGEIRTCEKKATRYDSFYFAYRAKGVFDAYAGFQNYLVQNGIFVPPDLKEKFFALSQMIHDAIEEKRRDHFEPMPGPGRFAKGDKLWAGGQAAFKSLEAAVQSRLWDLPDDTA